MSIDEKTLVGHQIISELVKVVGFSPATEIIIKKNMLKALLSKKH